MPVWIIEDELFFSQYKFHKQKLMLHRASMKFYADYLIKQNFKVHYVNCQDASFENVFQSLSKNNVTVLHLSDTEDYLLNRRMNRYSKKYGLLIKLYPSPNFITTKLQLEEMLAGEKRYLMANFYIKQRKRLKILVEKDLPVGGQWSFDAENRKRIPKGLAIPKTYIPTETSYLFEARKYISKNFDLNFGSDQNFLWPVNFEDAERVLEDFLISRMMLFGDYEDAIAKEESILFHSVLTPALNIGLLTPEHVINKTLELYKKYNYPLNSLEGFIRQIIGWREFMRAIYCKEGVRQRTQNFWKYKRKIPASFYTGNTGIEPIDQTIKKILATGYCHHIERLMVLGNFMQLCEFDPDEVYRWFMELFIDAYDWVMVPNVYGMSQYADAGMMTTKPYVSGSNYLLKMSDYKKGPWCEIWDALYWRYIHQNKNLFAQNPRMSMMVNLVNKMDKQTLQRHLSVANRFIDSLG